MDEQVDPVARDGAREPTERDEEKPGGAPFHTPTSWLSQLGVWIRAGQSFGARCTDPFRVLHAFRRRRREVDRPRARTPVSRSALTNPDTPQERRSFRPPGPLIRRDELRRSE
ncbi:hypothetical protein JCM17823_17240 [Halorubrum gandharaense]